MADSVYGKILDQVESSIEGLSLTGITDANIVQLQVPVDKGKWVPDLPAVLICPFGVESLTPSAGSTSRDDIGYPVLVAILDEANRDQSTGLDKRLLWREKIRQKFHDQKLGVALTADSELMTTVEPGPVVDQVAWFQKNLFVSAMTLRVGIREART